MYYFIVDSFLHLFELEDVLIKVGLKPFVGVIDAKLLETIPLGTDVLETEYI